MSCHPERSEGSVNTKWMYFSLCSTTRQILRDAQNETLVGSFHFDAPSYSFTYTTEGLRSTETIPDEASRLNARSSLTAVVWAIPFISMYRHL